MGFALEFNKKEKKQIEDGVAVPEKCWDMLHTAVAAMEKQDKAACATYADLQKEKLSEAGQKHLVSLEEAMVTMQAEGTELHHGSRFHKSSQGVPHTIESVNKVLPSLILSSSLSLFLFLFFRSLSPYLYFSFDPPSLPIHLPPPPSLCP